MEINNKMSMESSPKQVEIAYTNYDKLTNSET